MHGTPDIFAKEKAISWLFNLGFAKRGQGYVEMGNFESFLTDSEMNFLS